MAAPARKQRARDRAPSQGRRKSAEQILEESLPSRRHALFVACMSTVSGVLACVVPLAVNWWQHKGEDRECLMLYADVRRSADPSVSPCDDFHRHVCAGWTRLNTPLEAYKQRASLIIRNAVLLQPSGPTGHSARDKAHRLFVRCLSHAASEDLLRSFLQRLKLGWPLQAGTVSRVDFLDTLVGSSLDYGVPSLWSMAWIAHVLRLVRRRRARLYLRRCAEIIGGTGQSYEKMIQKVLRMHTALSRDIYTHYGFPDAQYVNLSDVDMRVAMNRHLPDSSQLWPKDEMLVLHLQLFRRFLDGYTSSEEARSRAQLYIGAYVVWYLSPLASQYLTRHLMADLGLADEADGYKAARCFDAIAGLMPLAVWKMMHAMINEHETAAMFEVFGEVRNALYDATRRTDVSTAEDMRLAMNDVSLNAFNMSVTWETVEQAYHYVPMMKGSFLSMYLTVASAGMATYKDSHRNSASDVRYLPIITLSELYRMLVLREVGVPVHLAIPPLFHSSFPVHLKMAVLGKYIAFNFGLMFYYIFYRTASFKLVPFDLVRYSNKEQFTEILLSARPVLLSLSLHPSHYVPLVIHSYVLDAIQRTSFFQSDSAQEPSEGAYPPADNDGQLVMGQGSELRPVRSLQELSPWELHRLFYLVSCFAHCRSLGDMSLPKSICNVALPASAGFSRVFKCATGDAMFFNTTWE
ncbi:hypothetical protein V5799_017786 [Amblyomma americanum]|uniref:Uncharacterized protein n=1 Tax=Amblyomma americanum TaxID=6943 RepID=A0AAQ4F288_AMBAM